MSASPLDQYVCFNFYNGWRTIQRFYKDALGRENSAQQSYVFELCEKEKGVSISYISKQMKLDKSAVSTLISRMEKSRLVTRNYDPMDRRAVNVKLTEKGHRVKTEIRNKMMLLDTQLYSTLTKDEIATLKGIVKKLSNVVESNGT